MQGKHISRERGTPKPPIACTHPPAPSAFPTHPYDCMRGSHESPGRRSASNSLYNATCICDRGFPLSLIPLFAIRWRPSSFLTLKLHERIRFNAFHRLFPSTLHVPLDRHGVCPCWWCFPWKGCGLGASWRMGWNRGKLGRPHDGNGTVNVAESKRQLVQV